MTSAVDAGEGFALSDPLDQQLKQFQTVGLDIFVLMC